MKNIIIIFLVVVTISTLLILLYEEKRQKRIGDQVSLYGIQLLVHERDSLQFVNDSLVWLLDDTNNDLRECREPELFD